MSMAPHSSTLAWKLPWTESLVGCSPWGRWELDMTRWLHFHFSLSCIGEGNGNPLQCPCLENPRDGGAWWAAVSGVAQSWTRLKRLSSSSSPKSWNWLKLAEINYNYYPPLFFALLYLVLQCQTCLLLQVSLDFLFFHSSLLWWEKHLFFGVSSRKTWSSSQNHSTSASLALVVGA